jgi:hypothetical protein
MACFIGFLLISCDQGAISPPKSSTFKVDDVTISKKAKLTVNQENPGGPSATEGSKSLIDNDKDTKFLVFDFYGSVYWAQQSFNASVKINAYSVSSANDVPDRDPKDWKLKGSNDGTNWKVIDTQTDVDFSNRKETKIFHLKSDVSYKYYRLNITEDKGGGALMQLSDWDLLYYKNQD